MNTELSRNELLKMWCDQVVGRASKLGKLAFPHHSYPQLSISNYKGKREISDSLWATLIEKMEEIESIEIEKKAELFKTERKKENMNSDSCVDTTFDHYNTYGWGKSVHDQSYDEIRHQQFKDKTKQWLMKDEIAKLRMIDLAYVVNYGTNKDFHSTYVSNILKKGLPVSIDDENRIYKLMNHIDDLIESRHTFYIAASLNTESTFY